MNNIDLYKIDKTTFSIGSMDEECPDKEYWLKKSPAERLEALELMRQVMYGYDPATARLQRIFTITTCA